MTEENRRANVELEWNRAGLASQAVRLLVEGGIWPEAVARSYYAAFYAARALLFSRGLEARSHHGVVHLLSLYFVREGKLTASMVRSFSLMQQAREDADYQSALSFDEESARRAQATALDFIAAAESLLRVDGFIE